MAGYVPDVDAFSMLSGIGDTLQKNQQQKDAPALISALLGGQAPAPQQPGIFGQIVNGAKNIFAPQPQAVAPTPVVNQRPVSSSTAPVVPTGFDSSVNRTLGFEGGLNPSDTNGTPSNYGINQQANPNVDVTQLTPDKAKQIYKTNYWDPIGGDNLPPALAHVAFDTAVIAGPAKAQQLLQQSGGDPQKLLALRSNFQQQLLQSDPAKYGKYAQAWGARNDALQSDITAAGSSGGPMAFAGAQPPTSPAPGLSPSTPLPGAGYTAVQGYAGGTPAPNANPNASQQPTASPALPTAPQGVPSVGSTQTPMGQQIPPLSTEALSRALTNPYTKDLAQGLLTKYAQPNTIQTIGNTVYSVNARTSTLTPIMQVPKEPSVQELPVTGPDGTMIGSQKYWVSPDKAPVPLGGVDTSKMKSQSTDLITPEDRQAHGIDPSFKGPVQVDENGKLSFPGKPTTEMTLNQNNTSKLDGKIIDVLDDGRTKAEAAVNTIAAIKRQKDALNGGMITGVGADLITSGKQALAQVLGLDPSTVTNSQVFDAAAKQKGAELAKALSNSGHTTNADLAVGNIIAGGDRTKTEDALRTIIAAQEQLQRDTITRHNNNVDKFVKINPGQTDQANFFKVDLPTETGSATDKPGTQSAAQPQARQPLPQGYSAASAVAEGRAAIAAGKDPAAVAARLQSYGIDPKNLSAQ